MRLLSSRNKSILKMLRPWQWAKNLLIIVPLLLSNNLILEKLLNSVMLFILFSLFVSGNYIMNDLNDVDLDKNHPEKRFRPIASGKVNKTTALIISFFLFFSSSFLTYVYYEIEIIYLFFLYLGLATIYTKKLKFINLIDSLTISGLFLIRIIIGGVAAKVAITNYLYVFILLASMFIVYLKKNSILNKDLLDNNSFHKVLKLQNHKFSFGKILYLLGTLVNISLILWGINSLEFKSLSQIFAFFGYNIIFIYITFLLIKNSNKAKLEDFVFGILEDRSLFRLLITTFFLFIYFYF
jgi:4-hydroxybenzoate polyprenyltransferase